MSPIKSPHLRVCLYAFCGVLYKLLLIVLVARLAVSELAFEWAECYDDKVGLCPGTAAGNEHRRQIKNIPQGGKTRYVINRFENCASLSGTKTR